MPLPNAIGIPNVATLAGTNPPPSGGGGGYQFYRLTITKRRGPDDSQNAIAEIQFALASVTLVAVPSVSWDAQVGDTTFGINPNNCVDGDLGNKAYNFSASGEPPYRALVFDFGVATQIDSFRWYGADVSARDPVQWIFAGSNDGTSYTTLHTQSLDYAGPNAWSDWFTF